MKQADRKVLESYAQVIAEKEAVVHQWQKLRLPGQPSSLHGMNMDGMPRGTNDPDSAAMQAIDGMAKVLCSKWANLEKATRAFEKIIESVPDGFSRSILRMYYGAGVDEKTIAETIGWSRQTVNRVRNDLIRITDE